MALLGNIIWFFLGGWLLFIFYMLAAIIFFPAFIPLSRLAVYSLWPFGKSVVSQSSIEKFREITGKQVEISATKKTLRFGSGLLNIVWILTFGWMLALTHFIASLLNLFAIFLIVTIPNIVGHWRLIPVAFMPFNKVVVPAVVAEEIRNTISKNKLGI